MIKKFTKAFRSKMLPVPVEFKHSEVMDAWSKIDRILAGSYMDTHVEAAQKMFNQMLHHFAFTDEQRMSPLIIGMQDKINDHRAAAITVRK